MSAEKNETRDPSPDELRQGFRTMRRLEWITLFYQLGAAALVGWLMGGSQTMKTEWMENALAIVPVVGALLTYRFENKPSDKRHPFGYHRTGTIAFLAAAFVLAGIGTFLCYDSSTKLLRGERPVIGGYPFFGHTIWHGWLMIAVMFVTAIPPVLLARKKLPVARLIHDKPLHADADMNHANWVTNGSGMIGLTLVALGFWWGDSAAALLISLDILRDGWTSVARSLSDVMDHHPVDIETDEEDPIIEKVRRAVRALPFVSDERLLLREHGRYLFAEIFVRPHKHRLPEDLILAGRQVREAVLPLDWRLQHVAVEFTDDLDEAAGVLTREEIAIESA